MMKKLPKSLFKTFNKEPQFSEQPNAKDIELKKQDISGNYEHNLETFTSIFSFPKNTDIKVREFTIRSVNRRAFIIFISTMVDLRTVSGTVRI